MKLIFESRIDTKNDRCMETTEQQGLETGWQLGQVRNKKRAETRLAGKTKGVQLGKALEKASSQSHRKVLPL